MTHRWGSSNTGSGFAILLILLVGLGGCGMTGQERAGDSPTRAVFTEQANGICEQANEELRQAMIDAFGPGQQPDDEAGIRFTREIWVPSLRQQDKDLRALEWPAADHRRIEAMLRGITDAADRVEADPGLASEGPFDDVTRELTEYGIGPCGSP